MEKYIEWFKNLGLQEYQAKAFVALLSRSDATAKEIADISKVPPTKVYNTLLSLENMGFVKSTLSRPKRYRPIDISGSVESLIERRKRKIIDLENQKEPILEELNYLYDTGKEYETPKESVWMVSGEKAVWDETENMIKSVNEEFNVLITSKDFEHFFYIN